MKENACFKVLQVIYFLVLCLVAYIICCGFVGNMNISNWPILTRAIYIACIFGAFKIAVLETGKNNWIMDEKQLNHLRVNIVIIILLTVFAYLLFAFVSFDLNPGNWIMGSRGFFALSVLAISFFTFTIRWQWF